MVETTHMVENMALKQEKLIDFYVKLFNDKIDNKKQGSHGNDKFIGSVMENSIREMICAELVNQPLSVQKCYIRHDAGSNECDIVIFRKDLEDKIIKDNFYTVVVDPINVLAVIEIKTFADSTGLSIFNKFLHNSGLDNRGYFLGITGSVKGAKSGLDLKREPKIFILADFYFANIKKTLGCQEIK